MTWRKICPTCGFDNPPEHLMCDRCLGDVSAVAPAERPDAPAPAPAAAPTPGEGAATRPETPPPLRVTLVFADGGRLPLAPGDEVGRDALGGERFAGVETVSRRHARIDLHGGKPAVVDLGSMNGTWLAGVRLAPGVPAALEDGAELRLSSRVVCKVEVRGEGRESRG